MRNETSLFFLLRGIVGENVYSCSTYNVFTKKNERQSVLLIGMQRAYSVPLYAFHVYNAVETEMTTVNSLNN